MFLFLFRDISRILPFLCLEYYVLPERVDQIFDYNAQNITGIPRSIRIEN